MFSCDNGKHKEAFPADTFTAACFYLTHMGIFFSDVVAVCVSVCLMLKIQHKKPMQKPN